MLIAAYLLGALPFTVALAVTKGIDVSEGDLHIALWHRASPLYAALAVVVDIAKGAFPVLIGFGFSLPVGVVALAGAIAVIGQMWPPLHGHGEKGNSTAVGALFVLLMVYGAYVGLLCFVFFAVGAAVRYAALVAPPDTPGAGARRGLRVLPLCMLVGFASAPLLTWVTNEPVGLTLGLLFILVAIIIRRLTAGVGRDIEVGASLGPVLVRRLLFDETLVRDDW